MTNFTQTNWQSVNLVSQADAVLNWNEQSPWDATLALAHNDKYQVYYSPFEYVNLNARIVIVGITPGITQAALALNTAKKALMAGDDIASATRQAKVAASFGGAMRNNLVAMLDHIGVASRMGLPDSSALFTSGSGQVHFTSVLRFPVLERGEMLSNAEVALRDPLMNELMKACFAEECRSLNTALFLPLGKGVERVLLSLASKGVIPSSCILAGLPHPSGANAERIAYFLGRKPREALSAKTNANKLDAVREQLLRQVAELG